MADYHIAAREDDPDWGDALICDEGTVGQAFPRWSAATREEPVRVMCAAWLQSCDLKAARDL